MQDRYLGNDSNVNRLANAANQAVAAPAQAAQQMSQATAQTTSTIIQGQAQLQQIEMQRLQSEIARAKKPSGLAALAQVGTDYVMQTKAQEANELKEQKRLEAEQAKLNKQALDEQSEREFTIANNEVMNLQGEYEKRNWEGGTTNFKEKTAKLIARYPNLKPEQINKLLSHANTVANARDLRGSERLRESAVELKNERYDNVRAKLKLRLTPALGQLAKLGVHEQSTEFINRVIQPKVDEILKESGEQFGELEQVKFRSDVFNLIAPALNEKSDAYAEYVNQNNARQEWIKEHAKAQSELDSGKIGLAEYKDRMLGVRLKTGVDFSEYQVSSKDVQNLKLEKANMMERLAQLDTLAKERQLENLPPLGSHEVRTIAAGILSDPDFAIQVETNPRWKNFPAVRTAQTRVKRYREFQSALTEQKIVDAETATKFQRLNLTNVNNFVSLARSIALKNTQQKPLSPLENVLLRTFSQSATNDQTIAAALSGIGKSGGGQLTQKQMEELQTALEVQRNAIRQVQQSVFDENQLAREKIEKDFDDVIQLWGGSLDNRILRSHFKDGIPALQQAVDERLQSAKDAAQKQINAEPYGTKPNFTSVGGKVVGSHQHDGGFKVAPKTSLQVQSNRGEKFITPIQAGINKWHSFNSGTRGGALGGGYGAWRKRGRRGWVKEHAGIDFPLSKGERAMTVVSGKVLSVRNLRGYGGTIDFLGDDGFVYRYAHQRSLVKPGQRLAAGAAISTSNGSGAGAPHLHFEVRPHSGYKKKQFGMGGTVDPVAHLRALTKKAGTTVGSSKSDLRGQPEATKDKKDWLKVEKGSVMTSGGGAINGGIFQQVGKPSRKASSVFNNQRPMSSTTGLVSFRSGTPNFNYESNFGFTYLAERPELRKSIVDAAKELSVPPEWIVDIAAQETGGFRMAEKMHPTMGGKGNNNFGLFGFGSDSGVKNYQSMNPVQQVHAYVKYMKDNGWLKHIKRVGGNSTIAQFWAMTRMGWKWRQQALKGRIHYKMDDSGLTYLDELRMLGNHVGREYDLPGGSRSGRSRRSSAIRDNIHSDLQQALSASGTYITSREG